MFCYEIASVYTNYENEGKDCQGQYSVILGTWVSSFNSMPENFAKAVYFRLRKKSVISYLLFDIPDRDSLFPCS